MYDKCNSKCNGMFALISFSDMFYLVVLNHFFYSAYMPPPPPTPGYYKPPFLNAHPKPLIKLCRPRASLGILRCGQKAKMNVYARFDVRGTGTYFVRTLFS